MPQLCLILNFGLICASVVPQLCLGWASVVPQSWANRPCLLVDCQFFFRKNISTELAVLFLTDYIRKQADSGSLTGALCIDFSKSFDTISHSLLLDKLPSYDITDGELGWFTDYLFLRKQAVEINGRISNVYPVYTEVPSRIIIGLTAVSSSY